MRLSSSLSGRTRHASAQFASIADLDSGSRGAWIRGVRYHFLDQCRIQIANAVAAKNAAKSEEALVIVAGKQAIKARDVAEEGEYRSRSGWRRVARVRAISHETSTCCGSTILGSGRASSISWIRVELPVAKGRLYSPPFRGHLNKVTRIAWSPDGERVAIHGEDNRTSVLKIKSGEAQFTRLGLGNQPETLGWSRDGERLVVGATDNLSQYRIRVLDGRTGDDLLDFDKDIPEIQHSAGRRFRTRLRW